VCGIIAGRAGGTVAPAAAPGVEGEQWARAQHRSGQSHICAMEAAAADPLWAEPGFAALAGDLEAERLPELLVGEGAALDSFGRPRLLRNGGSVIVGVARILRGREFHYLGSFPSAAPAGGEEGRRAGAIWRAFRAHFAMFHQHAPAIIVATYDATGALSFKIKQRLAEREATELGAAWEALRQGQQRWPTLAAAAAAVAAAGGPPAPTPRPDQPRHGPQLFLSPVHGPARVPEAQLPPPPQAAVGTLRRMGGAGLRLAAFQVLGALVEWAGRPGGSAWPPDAGAWPPERRVRRQHLDLLTQRAWQLALVAPDAGEGAPLPVVNALAVLGATSWVACSSAQRTDAFVLPRRDAPFEAGVRGAQQLLRRGDTAGAAAALGRLPEPDHGDAVAALRARLRGQGG
jgi:hypothetical protein